MLIYVQFDNFEALVFVFVTREVWSTKIKLPKGVDVEITMRIAQPHNKWWGACPDTFNIS